MVWNETRACKLTQTNVPQKSVTYNEKVNYI